MRVRVAIIIGVAFCLAAIGHAGDDGAVAEPKVEASLLIDAPVAEVWEAALDVPTWPEWIDFIKSSSLKGEKLELGSTFKIVLKAKGIALPFKLTVCEYDEHERVTWWTGSELRIKVQRSLIFEDQGGKTLVTSREWFSGPMAKYMFKAISEEELTSIHVQWLAAIKARVDSKD